MREILNSEIRGGTASWTTREKSDEDMTVWYDTRRVGGYPVLTAERAGQVVGYGSYGPFRAGEGYRRSVEHSVYVASEARGQGIGRALLAALMTRASEAGLRRMVGGVSGDQAASLGLHRALGFEEQGRLVGIGEKAGQALDLVFMVRMLDRP